jgi:hypothetical protein
LQPSYWIFRYKLHIKINWKKTKNPGRLLKNSFPGKLALEEIGFFESFSSDNDFSNTLLGS